MATETPIQIDGLQVIGYSDSIPESMLPTVVPPVFQMRAELSRVFVPPYHMNAGYLYNATEISLHKLHDLAHQNEVTLFGGKPLNAVPDFELWLAVDAGIRYERIVDAKEKLRAIADNHIAGAEAAFELGQREEADRLAGIAACADDSRIEPYAIRAAIDRMQGDLAGERLMTELAAPLVGARAFARLVESYVGARS